MSETTFLVRLADRIDALNDRVGRYASWLAIPVVGLLFLQVPLREIVKAGQETANDFGQLAHAALFMIGCAYAMRWDGHVRVDILYQRMGNRARAWVDLLGTSLFTLPFITIVGWYSVPIVAESWKDIEEFPVDYTPGYFLMKSLLLVFVGLIGLQAIANIARAVRTLLAQPRQPRP